MAVQYDEYIKSEKWQQTRKRYFSSKMNKCDKLNGQWVCYCCHTFDATLELHHRTYKRLGNEYLRDLVPVCKSCHKKIHEFYEQNNKKNLWWCTKKIRSLTRNPGSNKPNKRIKQIAD